MIKAKKQLIFIISLINFILAVFLVCIILLMPLSRYNNAVKAMNNGDYKKAFDLFTKKTSLRSGRQKAYICCEEMAKNGDLVNSYECYMKIKNYGDSYQKAEEIALLMFENNLLKESWQAYNALQDSQHLTEVLVSWQNQMLESRTYDPDFDQVGKIDNQNYIDNITKYIENIYDYKGIPDLDLCAVLLKQCNRLSDSVRDKQYLYEKIQGIIDTDSTIKTIMASMSLSDKVGQMIIANMQNNTDSMVELVKKIKPSGVIFFEDDITTYQETVDKVKALKLASEIPLFISVDQEGGGVQRIDNSSSLQTYHVPSMINVGNKNDEQLAYQIGRVLAEQLRVFGMNMDFAPVSDVNSNPNNPVIGNRSFSSKPDVVSKMSVAVANGLTDNDVIAVYKHFPGHGDTATDSHVSLPIINKTKEQLYETELKPFIYDIANHAEAIMIGHISLPKLTGQQNLPASLSKEIIEELLRKELGFKGVVITDSLIMGAVTRYYKPSEMYVKAVEAGVDLLLMPADPTVAVNSIVASVQNGTISEQRIDESVYRILKLKLERVYDTYSNYLDKSHLTSFKNYAVIQQLN